MDGPDFRPSSDIDDEDDEGGDGRYFYYVRSDFGDPAEIFSGSFELVDGGSGSGGDEEALEAEINENFFSEVPPAFRNWNTYHVSRDATFIWQHACFFTHILQVSVRAGLSVPIVQFFLIKVQLVGKFRRKTTNFQE